MLLESQPAGERGDCGPTQTASPWGSAGGGVRGPRTPCRPLSRWGWAEGRRGNAQGSSRGRPFLLPPVVALWYMSPRALDSRVGSRVASWPMPLPGRTHGGGSMGVARDSSPDASQASGAARLPLPARVWLRPLSSSEPRFSSGSRGASPRSLDTIPASTPPSMASPPSGRHPEACHLPHGPALRRHPSPGIGLRHPCRARASGPQAHQNDDDLHALALPRRAGGPQSSGCLVGVARRFRRKPSIIPPTVVAHGNCRTRQASRRCTGGVL